MIHTIYGIKSPDGFIRYIGRTKNPARRWSEHRTRAASKKRNPWVLDAGTRFVVLAEIESEKEAKEIEQVYILHLSYLENKTVDGSGIPVTEARKQRLKDFWLGSRRPVSQEHREKLAARQKLSWLYDRRKK